MSTASGRMDVQCSTRRTRAWVAAVVSHAWVSPWVASSGEHCQRVTTPGAASIDRTAHGGAAVLRCCGVGWRIAPMRLQARHFFGSAPIFRQASSNTSGAGLPRGTSAEQTTVLKIFPIPAALRCVSTICRESRRTAWRWSAERAGPGSERPLFFVSSFFPGTEPRRGPAQIPT